MGRRLQRTRIEGDPHPELFGADTAQRLMRHIRRRPYPFLDAITIAEGVVHGDIGQYLAGAQRLALKNSTPLRQTAEDTPEPVAPLTREEKLARAVLLGKTNQAVLARLQELTFFHATIAVRRTQSIRSGVGPYVSGSTPYCSTQGMIDLVDSLEDLSHGMAEAAKRKPFDIGFDGDPAAAVAGLAARASESARHVESAPYIYDLAYTDAHARTRHWTQGFLAAFAYEGTFAGDPARILYPIANPRDAVHSLGLQRYFPEDLIDTVIGMQNGHDVPFAEV